MDYILELFGIRRYKIPEIPKNGPNYKKLWDIKKIFPPSYFKRRR
jgi:hypothetical protein